jgi:choline dehydrogenase
MRLRSYVVAGPRIALEIASQSALEACPPAPDPATDADLLAYARRKARTTYHPTSTCAIGAVVDSRLRGSGCGARACRRCLAGTPTHP